MADQKFLDYAGLEHYDEKIKEHVAAEIAAASDDYDSVGTAATKVKELRDELFGTDEDEGAGVLDTLEIEVEKNGDNYVIKQGGVEIQTINIPKDMVVESGSVVVDPAEQAKGTYVELVLANSEEKIYINVKDLVDVYTAEQDAGQVQLVISATNEVSATIVEKSIGATELADKAVTSGKIAEKAVGETELADDAVTAEKIAKDAVTAEAIKDGAITADKLSVDAVQGNINVIENDDIDELFTPATA